MTTEADPIAEMWRNSSGEAWARDADNTDRQLEPLGRALLARLGVERGARVLDVGCGCGQTTLELAALVGETGRVIGIDLSSAMLACAAERARAAKLEVELITANAETHRFAPASFDLVFSRFGVMFFADAIAAFTNFHDALVAGGKLGFVCWQGLEQNPWQSLPLAAAQRVFGNRELPAFLRSPTGPLSFADPERVRGILSGAGFVEIEVEPLAQPLEIGGAATLAEAARYLTRIGPAARLLEENGRLRAPEVEAAIREAIAPFAREGGGVWLASGAFIVRARKER
jgi:SAM-dependent methyltransferase